jgi:hypothetical protein
MSDRYEGGILSGTAPTVTLQSANGVYTLSQELQYQGQGVWPTAAQAPILKSLRFRSSASAYLNRTPSSTGNRRTWTWSGWVKRGKLGAYGDLYTANDGTGGSDLDSFEFNPSDVIRVYFQGSVSAYLVTTQVFRDPSAWYHLVLAVDTTQATSSNRIKLYVNGVQVTSFSTATYPSQNYDTYFNLSGRSTVIGASAQTSPSGFLDGYLAEVNFVDGQQLTPSSFGTTDANGIWQPIPYTGTYGTNGFYLPFTNTTSTTTLGYDSSGNSNNWTTNNFSLTAGSTYDSMLDSPSNASSTIANYCVLSPIDTYDNPPTQGNLTRIGVGHTGSPWSTCRATVGASSGKWYFEATLTGSTGSTGNNMVGVMTTTTSTLSDAYGGSTTRSYQANGNLQGDGSTGTVASAVSGDVIMIAYDIDASKMWVGKNGTWQNSGNPVTGAGPVFTYLPTSPIVPQVSMYGNTGDNYGWYTNFGQQPFTYTPPTGFNRLNTYNLPVPTIPAGNKVMDATLYTGDGTSPRTITNAAGFQPDFVWLKNRSAGWGHLLQNSVVGASYSMQSNGTGAEVYQFQYGYLTSINSNGFTVVTGSTDDYFTNNSGEAYVGYQWNAGNGVTSSNTNGTITSTVSVNPVAGFSVVTYTGNLTTTGTATVGHGLGVPPAMIIFKGRNATTSWPVFHTGLSSWYYCCILDDTNAQIDQSSNGTLNPPTSTVFSTNWTTGMNTSGTTEVAYCFAPVAGYSAFGSYTGNGSSDGPFLYLGFRPKFILIKSRGVQNWILWDTSINSYNASQIFLTPDTADAESPGIPIDFVSNGMKIRTANATLNSNGVTYIYAAFAENPFKIARAR